MDRVRKLKLVLWAVFGMAFAVAVTRFFFGLGATTNLNDSYAWGFWIGFDVMGGVALAAGGFVITAIVYIFKREEFHAIVKPAVLTAFLGYVAVIVGLLFDLGLPWNIWHMMIFWNPHSPLFEVGWCVMLYTTVLLLEFSPVPLEPFSAWAKIRRFLIKWRMLFVILGISLSTLHQSSLGSLFLIMPFRLNPLWYSPILPILFFISAVMLGMFMVSWESLFTTHMYRREKETGLLAKLLGASRWIILLYLVVRFGDLAARGQLVHLFDEGWQTYLFWAEIFSMALIPFVLTMFPRVLRSNAGQWFIASFGVFGVVFNRTNVGGLAHQVGGNIDYAPAWSEYVISAGVVAFAALIFMFFVEKFKVWEARPADPHADPEKLPEFDIASRATLGTPNIAARSTFSLAFIIAMGVGFMLLSGDKVTSKGMDPTPVNAARGDQDTLWIDGNLDGYGVAFPHKAHENNNGGDASCVKCHHMNLPLDKQSVCAECHYDMYLEVDAFKHDWHSSPTGGNVTCVKCHEEGVPRSDDMASLKEGVYDCSACHNDLFPAGATIEIDDYMAIGYAQAMHSMCIDCHVDTASGRAMAALLKQNEEDAASDPNVESPPEITYTEEELVKYNDDHFKVLTRCTACHTGETRGLVVGDDPRLEVGGVVGTRSVLPPQQLEEVEQE